MNTKESRNRALRYFFPIQRHWLITIIIIINFFHQTDARPKTNGTEAILSVRRLCRCAREESAPRAGGVYPRRRLAIPSPIPADKAGERRLHGEGMRKRARGCDRATEWARETDPDKVDGKGGGTTNERADRRQWWGRRPERASDGGGARVSGRAGGGGGGKGHTAEIGREVGRNITTVVATGRCGACAGHVQSDRRD